MFFQFSQERMIPTKIRWQREHAMSFYPKLSVFRRYPLWFVLVCHVCTSENIFEKIPVVILAISH